jgi:hypothetical protein
MRQITNVARTEERRGDGPLSDLLAGYRFEVCTDRAAFDAALDVRRRVYNDSCGYDVPIPDAYDRRSWLLIARHVESGGAVGTMRITPRSAGRLEAEEYFWLPPKLRTTRSVEVNRFAILPEHRRGQGVMPAVSFGLFKLMMNLVMNRLGAEYIVVCSTEERIWTYEWLRFQRSGIVANYTKLGNKEHELLTMDLRRRLAEHSDHRLFEFIFESEHPEVSLPESVPGLGPDADNSHAPLLLARSA